MSNDNLNRVKMQLIKNPKLTASDLMKQIGVSKPYAYNLMSSARKSLGMLKQRDGTWKLKERMLSSKNRPEGMTDRDIEEIAADVAKSVALADIAIIDKHYPTEDVVNHPSHYKVGGIETIDFIEAKNLNYRLGNVVKYLTRADHKGERLENLKKAQWYLEREIAKSAQ